MEKKQAAKSAADQIAELTIGESAQVGEMNYSRVPGGYVVIYGSASCFVPLSDLACGELGIEFEQVNVKPEKKPAE